MDLSDIIKVMPASRNEGGLPKTLDLQPGDKLIGRVLQLENDGRALIDIGGPRVLARVGFAVTQGQALRLTVVESGPILHLRSDPAPIHPKLPLAAQANPAAALTAVERQALIRTVQDILPGLAARGASTAMLPPVVHALHRLLTLFDPLPMEKSTIEIAQWLRNALENHGSLFEKRLADAGSGAATPRQDMATAPGREPETPVRAVISRDVKSQLIVLKHALSASELNQTLADVIDAEKGARLRVDVEKMLQHVEQQQERAITRSRDGEPMQLFQHLLPMADGQSPVRLKVYYPRKDGKKGSNSSQRIALLLDMDRLGMVRGDISKMNDALQVHFYVQDEGVRTQFVAQLGDISSALEGSFDQVLVEVTVSTQKIAQFHQEDTQGTAPGRINIKA